MVQADAGEGQREGFVRVYETHAAVVFLVGEYGYKLKKPVDLGFLTCTASTEGYATAGSNGRSDAPVDDQLRLARIR